MKKIEELREHSKKLIKQLKNDELYIPDECFNYFEGDLKDEQIIKEYALGTPYYEMLYTVLNGKKDLHNSKKNDIHLLIENVEIFFNELIKFKNNICIDSYFIKEKSNVYKVVRNSIEFHSKILSDKFMKAETNHSDYFIMRSVVLSSIRTSIENMSNVLLKPLIKFYYSDFETFLMESKTLVALEDDEIFNEHMKILSLYISIMVRSAISNIVDKVVYEYTERMNFNVLPEFKFEFGEELKENLYGVEKEYIVKPLTQLENVINETYAFMTRIFSEQYEHAMKYRQLVKDIKNFNDDEVLISYMDGYLDTIKKVPMTPDLMSKYDIDEIINRYIIKLQSEDEDKVQFIANMIRTEITDIFKAISRQFMIYVNNISDHKTFTIMQETMKGVCMYMDNKIKNVPVVSLKIIGEI